MGVGVFLGHSLIINELEGGVFPKYAIRHGREDDPDKSAQRVIFLLSNLCANVPIPPGHSKLNVYETFRR